MTNFLEIKSKVARYLVVCCAMMMGMSVGADTYDDKYHNKHIVLAVEKDETMYAATGTLVSAHLERQAITLNIEKEVVYLTDQEEQKKISWHTWKSDAGNIIFKNDASVNDRLYADKTSSSAKLTFDKKTYFDYNSTYKTFTATVEGTVYGICCYGTNFSLQNTSFFATYPPAKPYFLADHTWRTLGASYFGTICLPKAVRAAERAGATFYEIAAKIVDEGVFKGIVLREVTGELTAGTPYIFKKNNAETTYIVAAMHGDAASASSSNGLVGVLGDSEGAGYAVPAGMYILQDNQLWETTEGHSRILEGRAYINPDGISTTVTSAEVAGVKGYVLGLDEPFDAVRSVKTERSGSEGDILDLQGRRVERVTSGRMYVIGGRKVLIR